MDVMMVRLNLTNNHDDDGGDEQGPSKRLRRDEG